MKHRSLYFVPVGTRIVQRMACLLVACVLLLASSCGKPAAREDNETSDFRPVLAHIRARQSQMLALRSIEQAIREFHLHLGRFPSNFVEIVKAGYIESIPPPPEGMGYLYDPETGYFRLAPLSPPTLAQNDQQRR